MQEFLGVEPSIDRTLRVGISGQYYVVDDFWAQSRWTQRNSFILSWADQHIYDDRYRFYEDDWIQPVYPDVETPWKFPDLVYVSNYPQDYIDSGGEGILIEPEYWDDVSGPILPPVGGPTFTIKDHSLPEHNMRVLDAKDLVVKATDWGPAHNIPKDTRLLLAPLDFLGTKGPEIGETWETPIIVHSNLQPDCFPNDQNMPHDDGDPIWNDGLDAERLQHNTINRAKYAHKRGTSDRMINTWGQYSRPIEAGGFDPSTGEITIRKGELGLDPYRALQSQYTFDEYSVNQWTWASPDHFGKMNIANFPRKMTGCLLCFNKERCRKKNSAAKFATEDPVSLEGKTGSIGFVRNHFVDVPENFNENTALGKAYAHSFCMYSRGSVWENGFASGLTLKERDHLRAVEQDLSTLFKRNDAVSDLCHVNGMPKRVTEYNGHYELLVKEVADPIYKNIQEQLVSPLPHTVLFYNDFAAILCALEKMGRAYDGSNLYRIYPVSNTWATDDVAQYLFEYGTNEDFTDHPTIAWFSTRTNLITGREEIRRVWGYIWYVSNHSKKEEKVKLKRLVELKPNFGDYKGSLVEAFAQQDFIGGSTEMNSVSWGAREKQYRGCYKLVNGKWLWFDQSLQPYELSKEVAKYMSPSGYAEGFITVRSSPGEIIPYKFLAYAPPKLIKWGRSKSDPSTQNHIGKTRYWENRDGGYTRETGDIDDLFYHLEYVDGTEGATVDYADPLPNAQGGYFPADASSINTVSPQIRIGNPYDGEQLYTELNTIDETDRLKMSDMQHARNFTAPIFGFELSSTLPEHHVMKPEFYPQQMDWSTRTFEPLEVAAQREYSPVCAMWCFAQNNQNREVSITLNLGAGHVAGAEGTYPIKIIWNPAGRVWWNRHGLLGCMIEQQPGKENFVQNGVAVVNLWRKIIPHHMQVVKAYLYLEPTLEHNLGEAIEIGGRNVNGFVPFAGIELPYDVSAKKNEINTALYWANYATRPPNSNQFLGGRIVGADVNAQIDAEDIWAKVVVESPKLLGKWEFRGDGPLQWYSKRSTQGWDWRDIYHVYNPLKTEDDPASGNKTIEEFMMEGIEVFLNGQKIYSLDPDEPDTLIQRDPKWYEALATLYSDGSIDSTIEYRRNANEFGGMNTAMDAGEDNGLPNIYGKGFGYSKKAGGWKARNIFDITGEVQRAYETRIDATFKTISPNVERIRTWQE